MGFTEEGAQTHEPPGTWAFNASTALVSGWLGSMAALNHSRKATCSLKYQVPKLEDDTKFEVSLCILGSVFNAEDNSVLDGEKAEAETPYRLF